MVFVVPTTQQNKAFLTGETDEAPIITSTSPSPAAASPSAAGLGVTPSSGQSTELELAATAPGPSTPEIGAELGFHREGSLLDRLYTPVQSSLDRGQTELGSARTSFYDQAGSERTFEGIGAQGTLQGFVDQGLGKSDILAFLNASYQGPQGLGYQGPNTPGQFEARTQGLGRGGTLQSIVQSSVPGLTSGQARFEARNLLSDPIFRTKTKDLERSVDKYFQDLAKEQAKAEEYASRRTEQEAGIADQSRGFLTTAHGETKSALGDRAAKEAAEQAQILQAREQLTQTGNLPDQLAKSLGLDDELSRIRELTRDERQAKAIKTALDEKYADLKNIPLAYPGRHSSGLENRVIDLGGRLWDLYWLSKGYPRNEEGQAVGSFSFEDGWQDAGLPQHMTAKQAQELGKRLLERQMEYERYFSPGTFRAEEFANVAGVPTERLSAEDAARVHSGLHGGNASGNPASEIRNSMPGAFTAFDPLFGGPHASMLGDPLSDPNRQFRSPLEYIAFEAGTDPGEISIHNVATPDERARVNRIAEVLGLNDMIFEEDPFVESKLSIDADRFQGDRAKTLEERMRLINDWRNWWDRIV